MKKKSAPKRRIIRSTAACVFCKENRLPDYKNFQELEKYLSERAKIYSSMRTGVCSRHQRKLSEAIKRARHLALLPYAPIVN